MTSPVTRLAPSPTGALHLGNARTFLVNWAMARREGWRIQLRIEDLDGPRIRPGAIPDTIEILRWLGLDWDGEPTVQSEDPAPYLAAMQSLAERGHVFPCRRTRSDVALAAGAPHEGDGTPRYHPGLRPAGAGAPIAFLAGTGANHRFLVPDETISIDDAFHGPFNCNVHRQAGDFVVWTGRDVPAYQLAVVVDDARQGVTEVVRGDDLLDSAARQVLLQRALGHASPRWWHVPLVRGPDGRRLAKRHGDTRCTTFRSQGVPAERIIGLLATWSGVVPAPTPMTSSDFRREFDVDRLPQASITFTEDDRRWLLDG